jgi:adenylate kinase family enzyme
MCRGISINGCAGSGKTTIGKELAEQLSFQHLDLDDYYWRKDANIPFTEMNANDVIIKLLADDISRHPHFVMSGSIGSILWDFVNPLFDLAVLLKTPTTICLERVKTRAFERFGKRVCVGGDLYKEHQDFYKQVELYETGENPSYSIKRHEKWASELQCPVLYVDGTKPISDNVEIIARQYLLRQ